MLVLFNVEIGNSLDDTTRNKVMVCESLDTDAMQNMNAMADMYIDLFDDEFIKRIQVIRPINVGTTTEFSESVKSKVHIF